MFGYFTGMLLFMGFSAEVITSLSNVKTLNSIEDLLAYEQMEILSSENRQITERLETSVSPIARGVWDRHLKSLKGKLKENFVIVHR